MTWFWQRKSDKQAECDASFALWLPPKTFSNPVLIRCMCKQLMCHAFNKQRLVFCELISPKIRADSPVLSTGRDVKVGWVPHAVDPLPSAFWWHLPADSHCLESSRWGSHCQTPSTTTSQKSSKKGLGCYRLSSPLLYGHSKPEGWLLSLEWEAVGIAVGSFWKAMDVWSKQHPTYEIQCKPAEGCQHTQLCTCPLLLFTFTLSLHPHPVHAWRVWKMCLFQTAVVGGVQVSLLSPLQEKFCWLTTQIFPLQNRKQVEWRPWPGNYAKPVRIIESLNMKEEGISDLRKLQGICQAKTT